MTAALPTEVEMAIVQKKPRSKLHRIRDEFHALPGLRLNTVQAQRLWGLDEETCTALLDLLVDAHFLQRTRSGAYVRADVTARGQ